MKSFFSLKRSIHSSPFLSSVLATFLTGICVFSSAVYASDAGGPLDILHRAKASFDLSVGPTEPQTSESAVPGVQGGLFFSYQGTDRILEHFTLLGSKLNFQLIGGIPTVRLRLDLDSPGFLLKAFPGGYIYYTPIVLRGFLTNHGTDHHEGPDGSQIGNSYAFGSTRFGIKGESSIGRATFSGGFEVGPEGGYIKDKGGQAPFAGFVAAAKVRMFSDHVFWGLGAEGHLNVLQAFDFDSVAQHGVSGNAELGFPIFALPSHSGAAVFSIGLRSQVDYFDIQVKNNEELNNPNGLSLYGGVFFRWEGGDVFY